MTWVTSGKLADLVSQVLVDAAGQLHGAAGTLHDQVAAAAIVKFEKRLLEPPRHSHQRHHGADGDRQPADRQQRAQRPQPEIFANDRRLSHGRGHSWRTSHSAVANPQHALGPGGHFAAVRDHDQRQTAARDARCRTNRAPRRPDCESRLPVGSSASSSGGSLARARAIATRCRCPTESWAGRCLARSANPTRANRSQARWARCRAESVPSNIGTCTFSQAVSVGSK